MNVMRENFAGLTKPWCRIFRHGRGDQVFLDLLLSGEKRFFSVKLQYEGDRLVEKKNSFVLIVDCFIAGGEIMFNKMIAQQTAKKRKTS